MKITGLALACLSLAGCSIIASSGDFEIPVDGGPGVDTRTDTGDVPADGGPDVQADVVVRVDVGPPPDCSNDEECVATNANAICGFEGTCVVQDCFEGFQDCDMAFNNGCEIDIRTSDDNCGRCGEVCDFDQADESCVNSVCEFEGCQDGFGDCNGNLPFDGCEVRLSMAGACGSCETVCLIPTSLCDVQDGVAICVPNCEAGEVECEGGCVDIETDPAHCGVCGAADCPTPSRATAICEMSMCGFACEDGRGDCNEMQGDGCEVDTMATVEHCGVCGMACEGMGALWTCEKGVCDVDQCDPIDQFSDCDGVASTGCEVDILNDPMNCGGCGIICDGLCGSGYCDPIDEVTGQDEHVCIRRRSGTMLCWGTNLSGQLGDGTSTARPLPAIVLDPESMMSAPLMVSEISVGQSNTCAIDTAGDIWCWGSSAGGATGSPVIPTTRPRRLSGDAAFSARTFTQIVGGLRSNCALDDEQHVWCWGSNGNSELGIGVVSSTVPQPTRVVDTDLSPLDDVVAQVVLGSAHGCARLMDGDVRCWGRNDRGQAGTGVVGEVDRAQDVGLSGITDIAAGDNHTCAVNAAGAMWCWGINDNGQFGNGSTSTSLAPVAVTLGVVSNVSAGYEHTCASIDGQPRCWGRGDDGELGTGTLADSEDPATPLGVSSSALLTAVHNYSCAFGSDGLACWGSNARGQLGREATIVRTAPALVTEIGTTATGISIERTHACAISDGGVYCWGQDPGSFGRLGGAPAGASPTRVRAATSVRTAINGTSINTTTGDAFGFGFNSGGRMALGTGARTSPAVMTFVGAVDEVGMGTTFACARQGSVVNCRGLDDNGQLGRGVIGGGVDDGPSQPVVGLSASQLSVGPSYVCAVRTDDQVVCWGDNTSGQLGNLGMVDTPSPTAIAPLDDAIMVSAGYRHACGVQRASGGATSGQVWCWGRNAERQSGDAVPNANITPNMVAGLADAVSVEAYTSHTCAIRSSGQAVCWGNNQNYELGDGTTDNSAAPVDVVGLTNASALGTGGVDAPTTCAVRTNGTASCWGGCWDGICGTGESLARPNAEAVQGLEL